MGTEESTRVITNLIYERCYEKSQKWIYGQRAKIYEKGRRSGFGSHYKWSTRQPSYGLGPMTLNGKASGYGRIAALRFRYGLIAKKGYHMEMKIVDELSGGARRMIQF